MSPSTERRSEGDGVLVAQSDIKYSINLDLLPEPLEVPSSEQDFILGEKGSISKIFNFLSVMTPILLFL